MRNWRIHIVPASHLDYGWAASPGECLSYVSEIIRTALEDLKKYRAMRFTIEYAFFMRHFLEVYPEYLPTVKTMIKEGRLEVCPGMSGFIEQWLDGEMIIHQLTRGKRWLRETLGYDAVTAQHTDLPGHILQIPQFLKEAEIRNLAYSRYHPPQPLHRWRAPDGSEVVAACHNYIHGRTEPFSWEGYGWGWVHFVNNTDMEKVYTDLPKQLEDCEWCWPKNQQHVLMGCESDLQPSDPAMLDRVAQWNKKFPQHPIRVSTVGDFFRAIDADALPTYSGEAPYSFFALPALYLSSSQPMRRAETAITAAEKWSVFGRLSGMGKEQHDRLLRARDGLFLPHDHNTGGRRGEVNDVERASDALESALEGESVLQEVAMRYTVNIKSKGLTDGVYPVTVFNSLSWNRDDVVETYIEIPMTGVKSLNMTDSKGRPVASQIVARDEQFGYARLRFVFVAKDVPAHGYETFYVRPSKDADKATTKLKISASRAANAFFDLRILGGKITSVKWQNRELARKSARAFNELYVVEDRQCNVEAGPWEEDKCYTGKQWDAKDVRVEVVETGPVRAVLRFSGKINGSRFTQDVILYDALDRIDVRHTVDYKAKMHTMMRVAYPLQVPEGAASYESPYGCVRLGKDEMPNTFRGQGERWVQKWVDISNRDFGVTLATRQVCHVVRHDAIEAILIRTATDCGTIFHYHKQDQTFAFDYSIAPHNRDGRTAAVRAGWAFNYPLTSCNWTSCFPIKPLRRSRDLPERDQHVTINADNVLVTAVAPSTDKKDAVIVRLVEFAGKAKEVELTWKWPVAKAEAVNFLEKVSGALGCSGNKVRVPVKAFGIHSIRVQFKRS